jgi:hypothetical protein
MSQPPELRPFWGHLSCSAAFPKTDDCLEISGQPFQTIATATGEVTPLGRTTCRSNHCATENGRALNGTMTLTAGDGNEVHLTYSAVTIEPEPLIVQQCELIVEGGTGRFAKASGQILGMVFVNFMGYDELEWPIEMALVGTITI